MPFKNAWFLPQTITRISDVCLSCLHVQWRHQQLDESHLTEEFDWEGKLTEHDYTSDLVQRKDAFWYEFALHLYWESYGTKL